MIPDLCVRPASAGTSTDVSRYAGQYEHVFEATTAGVTLQAPQLDINTVAAGGGSRLFFRSVVFMNLLDSEPTTRRTETLKGFSHKSRERRGEQHRFTSILMKETLGLKLFLRPE